MISVFLTWALAVHAGVALLGTPVKGLGDNGDFWRVTVSAGLYPAEARAPTRDFVVRGFRSKEGQLKGASSASCLAWMAKHLRWPFGVSAPDVDIRQMGLVYWLLAFSLLLFGLYRGLSPPLVAAMAWVLADPGYLLFFNSFLGDSALIVATVGAVVLLLLEGKQLAMMQAWSGRRTLGMGAALLALGGLGGVSKHQYMLFPAVLLGVCVLALVVMRRWPARGAWVLTGLAIVAVAAPADYTWGGGHRFPIANRYNSVFLGPARASSDGPAVLTALGIDARFHDRIGRHIGHREPLPPALVEQLNAISHLDVIGAWVADPGATLTMASFIQRSLTYTRTTQHGHFERATYSEKTYYEPPLRFSALRSWWLSAVPIFSWLVLVAALGWLGTRLRARRWGDGVAVVCFLLVWTVSQLVTVVVGEGGHSLLRHLVGARLALDLLFLILVQQSVPAMWAARRGAPVTQPS